jgi:hypothetical protein
LTTLSQTAFMTAMHASVVTMAVIVGVAAMVIGFWAPGRDGRQLRLARRLRDGRNPRRSID